MFVNQQVAIFFLLGTFCTTVIGTHKCVWVRGALQCHRDPSKQLNVEVRMYDRDGFSVFKAFDPDDLMGVTFTEPDGTFQLDGCGDDFNWLPGLQNVPDPYIRIHHYCNSEHGETIELPEFYTFVPETYDVGIIVLDAKKQSNATVSFPVLSNPRRRAHHEEREKSVFGSSGDNKQKKQLPSSVASAVDNENDDDNEEVTIFDVLNSQEQRSKFGTEGDRKQKQQQKSKQKNKKEEEVEHVTRPDDAHDKEWELPVELSNAEAGNQQAKTKKTTDEEEKEERRPNWTKPQ